MADDSRNADVGARYAQALFELAAGKDRIAAVEADLRELAALTAQSADLRRLVASPAFSSAAKRKGLDAVADKAGLDPLTRSFVGLLSANARVSALPAITAAFLRMAAEHRGAVAAEVTTALALTPGQVQGVTAALRQALGKTPEVSTRVDASILGGMRVRVGSRLYDASLKTRLDQLKFALKRA